VNIVRHDGKVIDHAEKKLLVFHCMDIMESNYDKTNSSDLNTITEEDIKLANIMRARFGKKYWKYLISRDISFLPYGLNLITMNDWNKFREALKGPLQSLLDPPHVACAVLTKAIHRKRSSLIPVCDDVVVRESLGANFDKKDAETILKVMDKFRDVGIKNLTVLNRIRDFLVVKNGRLDLTDLRMLEILYWMGGTPKYSRLFDFMNKNKWWT
jgi:hypothetical protein